MPNSVSTPAILAALLIAYTAYQAFRTRQVFYVTWLFANIALLWSAFDDRPEFNYAFWAGIGLTILLQLRSRRPQPASPEQYLRQARAESEASRNDN